MMDQILSNQIHLEDCTNREMLLTLFVGGYLAAKVRNAETLLGCEVAISRQQAINLRDWLTGRIEEGSIFKREDWGK